MSNFPIIPTTPPPLDTNESEEEEEPEFGSFNDVSDVEKDIDFVVQDFDDRELETNSEDKNCLVGNESIDEKIIENNSYERMTISCIINDTNITKCDNNIEIESNIFNDFSIKSNESLERDTDEEIQENDLKLDSDLNDITDNNSQNDIKFENQFEDNEDSEELIDEEFNDFECVNNVENGSDFADFTSFKFTENEEILNQNSLDDSQSLTIDKSKFETSFGDFVTELENNSNNCLENNENAINSDESDDDFADFASAQPVVSTQSTSVSDMTTNSMNSHKFETNVGEFADFSSFQDNKSENEFQEFSNFESNSGSDQESDKLTQIFTNVFPASENFICDENSPNISRNLFNNSEENSKNLWKKLQDLETAQSLKLRWSNSHSFQLLLGALNIDPRNILRSPLPMFASGLGYVLEPTKPKPNGDSIDENSNENECLSANTNGVSSVSIPPVQFDWSSSGLTNPLDINPKSMVAFDLDFFVTNDDVKNTNRGTGISNFEELLNDKNESNCESDLTGVSDPNKTNLVQKILTSVGNTSKSDGTQVLSAEALQVLDELPNLSFMRAKVLMFPIKVKSITNT